MCLELERRKRLPDPQRFMLSLEAAISKVLLFGLTPCRLSTKPHWFLHYYASLPAYQYAQAHCTFRLYVAHPFIQPLSGVLSGSNWIINQPWTDYRQMHQNECAGLPTSMLVFWHVTEELRKKTNYTETTFSHRDLLKISDVFGKKNLLAIVKTLEPQLLTILVINWSIDHLN